VPYAMFWGCISLSSLHAHLNEAALKRFFSLLWDKV
jgi:hypothetical protein